VTARGIVPQASGRRSASSAVLSTLALTVIVLAAPIGLYGLGGIPSFHLDLGAAAREISTHRSVDPRLVSHWVIRGALWLAWISWAWMTVCVALEIRSRVTGRSSARLPGSRSFQSLAACLVGAALAMSSWGRVAPIPKATATRAAVSTGSSAWGVPGNGAPPSLRIIDDLVAAGRIPRSADVPPADSDPASAVPAGADRSLNGSPGKAAASLGDLPPMTAVLPRQFDGLDDSGWAAEATGPVAGDVDQLSGSDWGGDGQSRDRQLGGRHGPPGVNTHRVAPRDTLWSVAADRLGTPLRWKEIAELNYDLRQPDGGALTAEHWIRPGWTLQLPRSTVTGGSVADGSVAEVRPLGPGATISTPRSLAAAGTVDASGDPTRPPVLPLLPVGAGVVGAGVVDLLERMRRVQQRHRAGGTYIRLPGREDSHFEQRLRLGEGAEIAHEVDCALRLFMQRWSRPEWDLPAVTGVTVNPETVQLTIDGDESIQGLFDPFVTGPGNRSISVGRAALTPSRVTGRRDTVKPPPAPLLVTGGEGTDGLIMVNLETLGTLIVSGDPVGCEGVIRALALELATSYWGRWFDLVVVGFGTELERFDRVMAVSDLHPLLGSLHRRRFNSIESLRTSGFRTFAEARCADGSDRWDPTVVVCGPTVSGEDLVEALELGSDPHLGIAVVAVGEPVGSPHILRLSGPPQPASLELLGSVVRPQQLEPEDLEGVTALVDTALNRQSVPLSEEPYVSLSVPMPLQPPTTEPAVFGPDAAMTSGAGTTSEAEVEVEVLVLGQIDVRGAKREFTRAWAKELVVYLAMHPHGASTEAWATALWPDRLMAPSSLHSTASVARRALGQARNGVDHLPRSHGRLTLSDTVSTDWDRFVVHADSDDPVDWKSALELVRGRPFEGIRSSDWPVLEGIGPAIEAAVVDLSGRLAGFCLGTGDPRGAEWAARKGLLVSPYDERLYRVLMRAADLAGNPAGVEAAMSELVRLVADDIEPLDSVHPSTMDLYRSLTRGRHTAARQR
jgi:hypothetical protein